MPRLPTRDEIHQEFPGMTPEQVEDWFYGGNGSLRWPPNKLFWSFDSYQKHHKCTITWEVFVRAIWGVIISYWHAMTKLPRDEMGVFCWAAHSLVSSRDDNARVWGHFAGAMDLTEMDGVRERTFAELGRQFIEIWIADQTEAVKRNFQLNVVEPLARIIQVQLLGVLHQIGGKRPSTFEELIKETAKHWYKPSQKDRIDIRPIDVNEYLDMLFPVDANLYVLQLFIEMRRRGQLSHDLTEWLVHKVPTEVKVMYKKLDGQRGKPIQIPRTFQLHAFIRLLMEQPTLGHMVRFVRGVCRVRNASSREKDVLLTGLCLMLGMTMFINGIRVTLLPRRTVPPPRVVSDARVCSQQTQPPTLNFGLDSPQIQQSSMPPPPTPQLNSALYVASRSSSRQPSSAPSSSRATAPNPDIPIPSVEQTLVKQEDANFSVQWRFSPFFEDDRQSPLVRLNLKGTAPYQVFMSFDEYQRTHKNCGLEVYAAAIWKAAEDYWTYYSVETALASGNMIPVKQAHLLINWPEDEQLIWGYFRQSKHPGGALELERAREAFIDSLDHAKISAVAQVVANTCQGLRTLVECQLVQLEDTRSFINKLRLDLFRQDARQLDALPRDIDVTFWADQFREDFKRYAAQYDSIRLPTQQQQKERALGWMYRLPEEIVAGINGERHSIAREGRLDGFFEAILTKETDLEMVALYERFVGPVRKDQAKENFKLNLRRFVSLLMLVNLMSDINNAADGKDPETSTPGLLADIVSATPVSSIATLSMTPPQLYTLPEMTPNIPSRDPSLDPFDYEIAHRLHPRHHLLTTINSEPHELSPRTQRIYKRRYGNGSALNFSL